jgi:CHAT domain-containing protein
MATRPDLADEAVHITGAFHLAGYQHVIGTLWPANDWFAARIARQFYACLMRSDEADAGTRSPAEALHLVVRATRTRIPGFPGIWAAYIHVGI